MNWIPTEWTLVNELDSPRAITICRMRSPYYEGCKFAVRRDALYLSIKGEWEYEPLPSNRDDEFFKKFRFDTFDDAKEIAEKIVRILT